MKNRKNDKRNSGELHFIFHTYEHKNNKDDYFYSSELNVRSGSIINIFSSNKQFRVAIILPNFIKIFFYLPMNA